MTSVFNLFLRYSYNCFFAYPACEEILALMTDIFKSGRSYSVIFSDTSRIEEILQKRPKSVNYTDNIIEIPEDNLHVVGRVFVVQFL